MARLAHRRRECPAEQDQTGADEPAPDHEGGQPDHQVLPGRGRDEGVHYDGIVPDSLPAPDANYSSGNDYIVEFLGYRFSFGVVDFEGRVVAAAVKLGVVESPELDEDEIADLVALAASGVIDQTCVHESLATIGGNLLAILVSLRLAGGFGPQYAGVTYYDPFLAQLAKSTDGFPPSAGVEPTRQALRVQPFQERDGNPSCRAERLPGLAGGERLG